MLLPKDNGTSPQLVQLGYGLNVMSPLLQNIPKSASQSLLAQKGIDKSPDPQISAWPKFRQEQKKKNRPSFQPLSGNSCLTRDDFLATLEAAIGGGELFHKVKKSLAGNKPRIIEHSNLDLPFTGNLNAKIGFMLDYAIVLAANDILVDTNDNNNLDEDIL